MVARLTIAMVAGHQAQATVVDSLTWPLHRVAVLIASTEQLPSIKLSRTSAERKLNNNLINMLTYKIPRNMHIQRVECLHLSGTTSKDYIRVGLQPWLRTMRT